MGTPQTCCGTSCIILKHVFVIDDYVVRAILISANNDDADDVDDNNNEKKKKKEKKEKEIEEGEKGGGYVHRHLYRAHSHPMLKIIMHYLGHSAEMAPYHIRTGQRI